MEVPKKNQTFKALNDEKKLVNNSKHFLLELYRCDYEKLNDESFLRCTLNNAAKLANATVLNLISNKFEPQGVTAIALLFSSLECLFIFLFYSVISQGLLLNSFIKLEVLTNGGKKNIYFKTLRSR